MELLFNSRDLEMAAENVNLVTRAFNLKSTGLYVLAPPEGRMHLVMQGIKLVIWWDTEVRTELEPDAGARRIDTKL